MTNYIWVTIRFEGFHNYPDAPKQVIFLRNKHRHMFHIKYYIEVRHNNREIEFFMFKKYLENIIKSNQFNNMSCEMISDKLYECINKKYKNRKHKIEVSEDGENGCEKEYQ